MIYKQHSIYNQGHKFKADFINLSEYIEIEAPISQTKINLLYSEDLNLFYFYQTFSLNQDFSTYNYPVQPNFANFDNLPDNIKNKIRSCEFAIQHIGTSAPLATMYIRENNGIFLKVQQGQTLPNGAYISPLAPIVIIGK